MFFLAIRHLIARRRQTTFTLLGILLGSCAFVVISSFFTGFQNFIIDQLINNDSHIRVSSREEFLYDHTLDKDFFGQGDHVFWRSPPSGRKDNARIQDPEGWYQRLRADPRVLAYSPQLVSQVIMTRAKAETPVRLIGSIAKLQEKVTNIADYMEEGKFSDIATGGNRIILGVELMQKLGARVGETVLVSTGKAAALPFKIMGRFKIGVKTLDEGTAFASLSDVQRVNGTPSEVTDIALRVVDVEQARNIAETWAQLTEEKVQSWDQANANFLNVVKIQNVTRYMMITVILIVASFGIYNILNMTVNQKKKEIAILRSMGYEQNEIIALFLYQGFILGLVGGVIGIFIGYWICLYMTTIPFGNSPLGSGTGHLNIDFRLVTYVQGVVLALVTAGIASFMPARAAGKMTPIDIIRGGAD